MTPADSAETMPSAALELALGDEAATLALAAGLARQLRAGDTVFLIGDLGVGKTAFARGLIGALPAADAAPSVGSAEEEVPSPTFTLVQIYERRPAPVWHVDLYRLTRPEEVEELGLEEALGEAIVLIEWPDRLGGRCPADRLEVRLRYGASPGARVVELVGIGAWAPRLAGLGDGLRDEIRNAPRPATGQVSGKVSGQVARQGSGQGTRQATGRGAAGGSAGHD